MTRKTFYETGLFCMLLVDAFVAWHLPSLIGQTVSSLLFNKAAQDATGAPSTLWLDLGPVACLLFLALCLFRATRFFYIRCA